MKFLLLSLVASCTSKDIELGCLDGWLFERFGSLVIGTPPLKGIRDIHLEAGSLLNRSVVVVGTIETLGDEKTYLIVKDDQGKLLVDLTNYYDLPVKGQLEIGKSYKILGFVKSGRKGLFHIAAHAMKEHQRPIVRVSRLDL